MTPLSKLRRERRQALRALTDLIEQWHETNNAAAQFRAIASKLDRADKRAEHLLQESERALLRAGQTPKARKARERLYQDRKDYYGGAS